MNRALTRPRERGREGQQLERPRDALSYQHRGIAREGAERVVARDVDGPEANERAWVPPMAEDRLDARHAVAAVDLDTALAGLPPPPAGAVDADAAALTGDIGERIAYMECGARAGTAGAHPSRDVTTARGGGRCHPRACG